MGNFIKKELSITIKGSEAFLDEQLYLFRNDRNIDLKFTITNLKFDFMKAMTVEEDVVISSNASFASIRVLKPNGDKFISEGFPIVNNIVTFSVTKEFIDELNELGEYKLQISLYDTASGKVTIPYVAFTVLEPIFEGEVEFNQNLGQIDLTKAGEVTIVDADIVLDELNGREELLSGSGLYQWITGDWITDDRMNAIHNFIIELHNTDVAINTSIDNINVEIERINGIVNDFNSESIENIQNQVNEIQNKVNGFIENPNITADKVGYTNDNSSMTNVQQALDYLLYAPITATISCNANTTNEIGLTIDSCRFNWSYNKSSISSQHFNGVALTDLSVRGYTYMTPFNSNKTFTLTASDGKTTVNQSISIVFYNRIYWGVSSSNITSTSYQEDRVNLINSLSNNELSNTKSREINVNAKSNQYIYYALPSRLGACILSVNGFIGGFKKITTVPFTNKQGYSENYDIYKSDNHSLGITVVNIS